MFFFAAKRVFFFFFFVFFFFFFLEKGSNSFSDPLQELLNVDPRLINPLFFNSET